MPKNNETTTKFKVDISELKKGIQDAQRQIRLANSEFKAATAGMDNWGKSADGLSAKINQLNSVLTAEKAKLENLEKQYALVAKEQGENSKGAEELLIKINEQRAAIGRTESSLSKYEQQLDDVKREMAGMDSEADDVSDALKEVDKSADDAGDGFTVMKGAIANLIADGLKKLAAAAVDTMKTVILETDKAYDNFQAQTGASAAEMKKFKEEINAIYKSGFGESIQDVADAMAEVKQQTKETDPSKLKELTENAIALRDTFDMDVKESMRAVNMLMEQFGITGEEAYNLISQGAQNGLDKNGDLLDTINEYGVHYKQLGYDADDFFNSLSNGTEAGTFSVDKLGDAMKEFGIRTKDTATTTQEGFKLLGYGASASAEQVGKTKDEIAKLEKNLKYAKLEQEGFNSKTSELTKMKNADKIKEYSKQLESAKKELKDMSGASKDSAGSIEDLQKRFAEGGDTAKKATQEVLKKLMDMDDKVKQNQIGVDLFGTMWEDLGVEGVKALMNTNGKLDMTKKSMEELKQIRYDNVATEFTKIGRTLQMDFLAPMAEKAIPYVKKFTNFIINNMDGVVVAIKAVGAVIATVFVVNKVATFTQSILTMITAFNTLKTATEGATIAQRALNLAQKANPVGLLIAGFTALGYAIYNITKETEYSTKEFEKLTETEQKNKDACDKLNNSYKELTKARDESISDTQSEFAYYDKLKNELDEIVDKNGKVKKGQEDRANFIVNTLNNALGTEIELSKGIVENYQKEKEALVELIEKKKAKIILQQSEASYSEAIKKQTESFTALANAQKDVKKTTDDIKAAEETLQNIKEQGYVTWAKANGYVVDGGNSYKIYKEEVSKAQANVDGLKKKLTGQNETVKETENTWIGYNATIQNYEGLSSAIVSGDTKKINAALKNLTYNFVTAETGNKQSLENQVKDMEKNYTDLQAAVKNGTPGVTKEMVATAKSMVDKSEKELAKLTPKAKTQGEKAGKAASDGVKSKTKDAEQSGKKVVESAKKGMASEDTKKTGEKKGEDFNKGVESKKSQAKTKGKDVSKEAKKGLEETKTKESGTNFVQGFINGIDGKTTDGSLLTSVSNMAGKAIKWLNEKLKEHSPSKETEKSGKYFTAGLAIGITKEAESVNKAVKTLAGNALKTLLTANKNGAYEKVGEKVVKSFTSGITKATNQAEKAVTTLVNKAVSKAKSNTKDSKAKKAFESLGKSLIDAFSTGVDKATSKAVSKVESKLDSLTSKFQEKYDAIKDLQSDLESRLKDTGELYTKDDEGNMILSNISKQTASIKQFGANLGKLKGKLSKELLAEIASMDTEEGLEFTNKLLSLSDKEIKAYNSAYTQKLKASESVAKNYYADQINTLKSQYTDKVKSEMKSLKKELSKIGENAVEGFLKAFKSKKVDKSVKSFCDDIIKTIKKKFKIKSPSRVMRDEVGKYLVEGIAVGVEKNKSVIEKAVEEIKKDLTQPVDFGVAGAKSRVNTGSQNGTGAGATNNSNSTTYTFNQYNNSPKALSRLEIYRQTRNQLNFAKGV